jgi:nucleoside-diphosphate-sugar epimerase
LTDKIAPLHAVVTGATGFVGRHVVSNLVANGYQVLSLARDVEKAKSIPELKGSSIFHFDISKNDPLPPLSSNSVLVHCAWGNVRDTQSIKHIEEHLLHNFFFIKNAAEQGIKKVVVTGTCFEYGLQTGPVTASTATAPNTPYALAKDTLHKALRQLQTKIDYRLIWARLFYMYGAGQDENSIVPLFDAALERGDKVFNMSFGEQILDFLPVEKVAEQIHTLLSFDDGIYNVCSGKPISLRRFLEQRMKEKNKHIDLNLGYYEYRKQDSMAIWGADPITDNKAR